MKTSKSIQMNKIKLIYSICLSNGKLKCKLKKINLKDSFLMQTGFGRRLNFGNKSFKKLMLKGGKKTKKNYLSSKICDVFLR